MTQRSHNIWSICSFWEKLIYNQYNFVLHSYLENRGAPRGVTGSSPGHPSFDPQEMDALWKKGVHIQPYSQPHLCVVVVSCWYSNTSDGANNLQTIFIVVAYHRVGGCWCWVDHLFHGYGKACKRAFKGIQGYLFLSWMFGGLISVVQVWLFNSHDETIFISFI